nr:HNH endonuclease [Mycoplasmopsis bovis]
MQCQNALDSINDENNLINLPKQVHDWFDKNKFYIWPKYGNIFLLDNELKNKWIVWIW